LASEPYNDKLSQNRADAARFYLIKKGIHPSRIISLAEGKKNPEHPNNSEENRRLNRRVDFFTAY